jgi:regulator of nucleoside diphosphate kinase
MTGGHQQGPVGGAQRVVIRQSDADVLHAIAMSTLLSAPRAAGALLDELHRAEIRADETVQDDVVGMGAWVAFVRGGEAGASPQRVQLVSPQDADLGRGRLSVLSGLGAGLIGLRAGQSIDWPDRLGGAERLTVVEVTWPADRRRPRRTMERSSRRDARGAADEGPS